MSEAKTIERAPFAPGGANEIDSAIAKRLLASALDAGGDYADLYFEYRSTQDFSLEDQKIKNVGQGVTMGLGVRVTKGDATGYAYCEELSMERMLAAAKTAGQIASSGGSEQAFSLDEITPPQRYSIQNSSLNRPPHDKLALLKRADVAARAVSEKVIKVDASFVEQVREVLVVSSNGRMVRDRLPMMRFGVSVVVQDGEKRQSGSSGGGGRKGLEYFDGEGANPEAHGQEAVRVAMAMLDAREAPAGGMEVVLAAGDSGILLHEAVGHGLEADFNRKGTSNYSGQIGNMVASELCTVVDDGTVDESRGAINVDDEGNVGQNNMLIEKGKLVGYMHDNLSAKHYGVDPSGNGRRQSFRCMPLPRMTNTSLLGGNHDPDEILQSVKRGVYAVKFSGGQVNISNGDFVFSLTESYLIEDGKITAPLKGVNLIGNGPEVLRNVVMLGSDFERSDGIWTCGKEGQSVPVGVGTPTIKISEITVGGTSAG
ncbi:MAG: metalloprotease TldD [Myxococcales bacterium]|nr:metalloprotease TldD [Myxococcales bacterium]